MGDVKTPGIIGELLTEPMRMPGKPGKHTPTVVPWCWPTTGGAPRSRMPPATAPERRRDAQRTRNGILEVARREFAERGYTGARVDEIAARTRTTKRMIYYYFGGKEQLFEAVLEQAYSEIRAAEQG